MKGIIFILIILILNAIATAQWINQVSGTNATLYDIEFINKNTGWAVGAGGTIIKTTNAGVNWFSVPNPAGGRLLHGIHPVDSNYVYAVGFFGTIIKTTNGGNNWTTLRYGVVGKSTSWEGVFFLNKDTGWICGDGRYVLRTTDGGEHFDSAYVFWIDLMDLYFKDLNLGVMCGWAGGTFKTTNAGYSWFRTQISLPTNQPWFRKLSFINQDTGWIAGGDGRVFRTTNFGTSWDSIYHLQTLPNAMYGVEFVNNNTGWVAGEQGIIYKTSNSGSSWYLQNSNTNYLITSLWFYNSDTGWASCGFGGMLHTSNGGLTKIIKESIYNEIKEDFRLEQNYPNPFNPTTTINFTMNKDGLVKIGVYDVLGREIKELVNEVLNKGTYRIVFNGQDLTAGVYFYRMELNGNYSSNKIMILTK